MQPDQPFIVLQYAGHVLNVQVARYRLSAMRNRLEKALQRGDYPQFIGKLQQAHDHGQLEDKKFIVDLLTGLATALLAGTTRGRKLSANEKAFYCMLLNFGGPRIHDFVSKNLLGPHLRTTQKLRAE